MQGLLKRLFAIALVFVLSACGGGEVSKYSQSDKNNARAISAQQLNAIFDDYFLEESNAEIPNNALSQEAQAFLPSVKANTDKQFADANVVVALDGSVAVSSQRQATDSELRIVATQWRQVAGPRVELLAPDQLSNVFISPDVETNSQLIFVLAALDSAGGVNSATVSVVVSPVSSPLRVTGGVVNEAEQAAVFTVKLLEARDQAVTLGYRTLPGTAVAGEDYQDTAGELTFAPGETQQTVSVALLGQGTPENFKTFSLQVRALEGLSFATNTAAVIIRSSDTAPESTPEPSLPTEPAAPPAPVEPSAPVELPTPSSEPTAEPTVRPTAIPTAIPTDNPLGNHYAPVWQQPHPGFSLHGNKINHGNNYIPSRILGLEIVSTESIDFDGNNATDIINTRRLGIDIFFSNGAGDFEKVTLEYPDGYIELSLALDMDDDGDTDIFILSDRSLRWYQQTESREFVMHDIPSEAIYYRDAVVSDIDSDGDSDILLLGGDIFWLETTGEGVTSPQPLVTGLSVRRRGIASVDRNADGNADIVLFDAPGLKILNNDGNMNFTTEEIGYGCEQLDIVEEGGLTMLCYTARGGWVLFEKVDEEIIARGDFNIEFNGSDLTDFKLVDWDKDGDLDMAIAARTNGAGKILESQEALQIFENTGDYNYVPVDGLGEAHPTYEFVIDDFNNDGQLDIVSSWDHFALSLAAQVSPEEIITQIMQMDMQPIGNLRQVDMNGDGQLDLLSVVEAQPILRSGEGGGRTTVYALVWFESGEVSPAKAHLIGMINYGLWGTDPIATTFDFDNDGDYDVVLSTDGYVSVFENDGGSQFLGVDQSIFFDGFNRVASMITMDYDNDGQEELILAGRSEEVFPPSPYQLLIMDNISIPGSELGDYSTLEFTVEDIELSQAISKRSQLIATDINADGYTDLVTSPVSWLLNSASGFGSEQVLNDEVLIASFAAQEGSIESVIATTSTFQVGDINADTHPDIVFLHPGSQRVSAHINNGEGGFFTANVSSRKFCKPRFIFSANSGRLLAEYSGPWPTF